MERPAGVTAGRIVPGGRSMDQFGTTCDSPPTIVSSTMAFNQPSPGRRVRAKPKPGRWPKDLEEAGLENGVKPLTWNESARRLPGLA